MSRGLPEWLEGLSCRDFLFDGGGPCTAEMWQRLDWSKAYVDMGPSPAGNLGPYWHVPRDDGTIHRLYPKILKTKWLLLIRQAIEEVLMARKVKVPASRAAAQARPGGAPAIPKGGGMVKVPASKPAAQARRGGGR